MMAESKKTSLGLLKIQKECVETYNKILVLYKEIFASESKLLAEHDELGKMFGPFHMNEVTLLNEKMVSHFKKDTNLLELLAAKFIRERVGRFLASDIDDLLVDASFEDSRQRLSTKLSEHPSAKISSSKQKRFSKEVIEHMEKFFKKNPYPSEAEKNLIAQYCGLTSKQVSNWFTNKRNRTKL